jgi:hypothetical protein
MFTKSGCIHSIAITVKKVSTSMHKIHNHTATRFIVLSISDCKVLNLLMQPVNSGGHFSAYLQEMKQHAEGHKKFTERKDPTCLLPTQITALTFPQLPTYCYLWQQPDYNQA